MEQQIQTLRATVSDLTDRHEYKSALFWSEKVVCLSSGQADDVLAQARCLFHLKEFHRAIHCIRSRDLHLVSLPCRHLLAKSHFLAKQFKEAADLITALEEENEDKNMSTAAASESVSSANDSKWKSSLSLLKAQIYEALDNRCLAASCFKEALKHDVHNYEAFQSLTQHQMLTHEEEKELLHMIEPEDELTRSLYSSLLKKYSNPSEDMVSDHLNCHSLEESTDLMTARAEACYYQCDYYKCIKLTTEVLNRDVFHAECLPVHISCLMELKKTHQLFDLAHKLVDLYPESAISWYAVGCYYLMISNTDSARRFLNKATTLDPVFGPAWLLYGHSFAVESEHDQAMAAYFKASHLMRGCHLPLHYIGLEYGQTENTKLAEKFFHQALVIAPTDPFVLHELGVVSFQNQDFDAAEQHFRQALDIITSKKEISRMPEKWEPLLNNLGHTMRKMKRYNESLEYHRQAMILSPQNSTTYVAIGFVYSLMFKWHEAVENFHKALGLKREDTFTSHMINLAMDHLISLTPLSDPAPPYESLDHQKGSKQQPCLINDMDMEVCGE